MLFSFSTGLARSNGVISAYVSPVLYSLCLAASLVCALFLSVGGFRYVTSSGNINGLTSAKTIIRNSIIGLVVVLSSATLTTILTHIYPSTDSNSNYTLPALDTLQAKPVSNGLVDILIKSITGVLNNIIQTIAEPFLKALEFFTTSTPLLSSNKAVFSLWASIAGIADSLFVLVVALLGFHIMSASSFGFSEISIKHLLPRLLLVFGLINCSIFAIDGIIELSNVMIKAVDSAGATNSVWKVLSLVVSQAGGQGIATLLIMICFLSLSVMLLVYYVGRIVTIYLGAILSPLVLLLWLVPGFRDFAESAAKVYLNHIFVLLVHVIILTLAASLFAGLVDQDPGAPNILMSMMLGLSTLIALIKTQGLMNQLSFAGTGTRTSRRIVASAFYGAANLTGSFREALNNTSVPYAARPIRSADPLKVAGIKPSRSSEAMSQPKISNPRSSNNLNKPSNQESRGITSKISLPTKRHKS